LKTVVPTLFGCALLAGCAGSLLESKTEAPEIYRLGGTQSAAPQGPTAASPTSLGVTRPRAATSLDTERIAVVQPGSRFDYYAGVRWSEAAPEMLQQRLVQALSADGGFATVVAVPSRVPPDLILDVELRRFEATYASAGAAPRVRVELQATLVDARRLGRVASFQASSEAAAALDTRRSVIAAFEQATDDAIGQVIAGVRPHASVAGR
jgi:cholesterol transport system auxiliary component